MGGTTRDVTIAWHPLRAEGHHGGWEMGIGDVELGFRLGIIEIISEMLIGYWALG